MQQAARSIALIAAIALLGVAPRLSAQTVPDLGAAESFAVFGTAAVNNIGATTVSGDVGVPAGGIITGFPPGTVTGTIDPAAPAARGDAIAAYIDLSDQAFQVNLTGTDLGGLTLTAGVYRFDSTAQLTTTLTLDAQGNPNAVFVLQIGSTLTTAANARVTLINGASALNVFWQIGTFATLGADVTFAGTLIAGSGVTVGAGTDWRGRVIAINGDVALETNDIILPLPGLATGTGEADLTLTKVGPSGTIAPNSVITYTIVVSNQGPDAATSVVVQDPTPAGLTWIATSGDCLTAFPCALGTLLAGRARTITVRYATGPNPISPISSTASVSSATPDPSLGNNAATAATPAAPRTYYLAEGATGTFFNEQIAIANPSAEAAPVTMTFFPASGAAVTQTLVVPARSHVSVHVDELPGLANTSTSAQITSELGLPLGVDRTMTWDATMYGGHSETAAAELATQWYFAEGALGYFETFLLLVNPQTSATTVTVTFLLEGAPPVTRTLTVAGRARLTLPTGAVPELRGRAFGMAVTATQPIGAERSMYFGTTATRSWSGGHASGGVSAASRRWFYAEGATGSFFDTFILMSNPQLTAAQVQMEYLLPNGTAIVAAKVIPAQGRLTVNIESEADVRLRATAVSTRITSDVPIVTERSMYWRSKTDVPLWSEGHNSFGGDQTAERWALAGGRVGGPNQFQTYVLLSNPWTAPANVTVTYLRNGQPSIVRTVMVPATTRYTLAVGPNVPEFTDEEFGMAIAVTNGLTINVERSIYWSANGVFWTAGTNATGTRLP